MARNLLIVHSSQSMRNILKAKVQANLSDMVLFEAATHRDALKCLKKTPCHIVLFAWEALDAGWLDFFQEVKGVPGITVDKFLLITSNTDGEDLQQARELGVKENLLIPCNDNTLLETINRICNPAFLRASKRYSIPGSKALIEQGGDVFQANIINISQGGVLCEIEYTEKFVWNEPVMITASFDKIEEGIAVTGLNSVLVRFTILNANGVNKQKRLRIAFLFQKIPKEVGIVLERVFAIADKLSLDVQDNVD